MSRNFHRPGNTLEYLNVIALGEVVVFLWTYRVLNEISWFTWLLLTSLLNLLTRKAESTTDSTLQNEIQVSLFPCFPDIKPKLFMPVARDSSNVSGDFNRMGSNGRHVSAEHEPIEKTGRF